MIPVVLLFTALGSTAARADMIVTTGGNVTGINGITVAGTTYNVTWGTAIDTTFAASPADAGEVNEAIVLDLTAAGASGVADSAGTDIGAVGADAGVETDYGAESMGGVWLLGAVPTAIFLSAQQAVPSVYAWDEFAVVATPEPGSAALTLTGLGGLLGLLVVMRKL